MIEKMAYCFHSSPWKAFACSLRNLWLKLASDLQTKIKTLIMLVHQKSGQFKQTFNCPKSLDLSILSTFIRIQACLLKASIFLDLRKLMIVLNTERKCLSPNFHQIWVASLKISWNQAVFILAPLFFQVLKYLVKNFVKD